ncbi:MAG: hypothetical protein ABI417_20795 [Coleofasciculaceae cyanobacterium]
MASDFQKESDSVQPYGHENSLALLPSRSLSSRSDVAFFYRNSHPVKFPRVAHSLTILPELGKCGS